MFFFKQTKNHVEREKFEDGDQHTQHNPLDFLVNLTNRSIVIEYSGEKFELRADECVCGFDSDSIQWEPNQTFSSERAKEEEEEEEKEPEWREVWLPGNSRTPTRKTQRA